MLPVFFDGGGRRWRVICALMFVLLAGLSVAAYLALPRAWQHAAVRPFDVPIAEGSRQTADPADGLTPDAVSALAGRTNTPVIGKGPLVRVLHVRQLDDKPGGSSYAAPLYSSLPARPLSDDERAIVTDHEFVIERYGAVSTGRQIALTFDDGPDPAYTPQILDILAQEKVSATFFVTGSNVVKHTDIVQREVREGHLVANHTFTHLDFSRADSLRAEQEINQTQRALAAGTGTRSSFLRLPYMGVDEQSMRDHLPGILTAQRMGYTVTSNEYDSSDWVFETGGKPQLPKLDGASLVVLLHDAGGDRSQTVAYVRQLIGQARAAGYQFVNLNQMYTQQPALYAPASPSLADRTSYAAASMVLVWPQQTIAKLFLLTVVTLLLTLVVNVVLAWLNIRRNRFGRRPRGYQPLVSVLIPAYNEEKVLAKTVKPVLRSHYRNIEVIIVDDGSSDGTFKVAKELARRHKRVQAFAMKRNGGKAAAMNLAVSKAKGEVIVGIDADTVFPPATLGKLVRHFADDRVGAVAGTVKVGNVRNMVTRWQALDYIIGITIERNAQAFLGAVMIVPGACGAWRRSAVLEAGGYSHRTLAEDFDLTLSIQRLGRRVIQDNEAISYTEAPETVRALSKQRFRWMYGNVQAYWKHRDMIFRRRHGWAGMFVLPSAIFNFMLPVVFVPVLWLVALQTVMSGNAPALLLFFGLTITIQALIAIIGIVLAKERASLLWAIPMTRLMYSPMRTLLMYRTILSIMRGVAVGWNKLQRSGAVQYQRTVVRAAKRLEPATASEQETGS